MQTSASSTRLYFLDWVRILAFFVLILYHVGMFYVSGDWHVKSPSASSAIEPLMLLSSPWRLGLLFMISGVAANFMLGKVGALPFLRMRSARLLIPLLFGMLVIVPPQPYLEVVEKVGYAGSYADFMRLYLSAYQGFCKDGCLILPTWNHLWFLPYLWAYTLVYAVAEALLGKHAADLSTRLAAALTGWKLVLLPVAVLALVRQLLAMRFPTTHALVDDWFSHAHYVFLFLLGAALARQPQFWLRVAGCRFASLASFLGCWATLVIYFALPLDGSVRDSLRTLQFIVYSLCEWSAILAVCGFAREHLQFDSAKRRYLTEAVFPVYILHQTLIVVLAHSIQPAHLAPVTEALLLITLTLCLSFGIFEVVRRVPWLRPLFGLGPIEAQAALQPQLA